MITTTHQTIAVADITNVVVTEPEAVGVSGTHVREIRVFAEPGGNAAAPVFVLRLEGGSKDVIALSAPEQKF